MTYRKRPVNDKRYSDCVYPLDKLDWSTWFMDAFYKDAWRYIHVYDLEHDSVQRVRPRVRRNERARLSMEGGVLYWLIDKVEPKEGADRNHTEE